MKKLLVLVTTTMLLAGCGKEPEPIKTNHFNVECTNCLVNFENSLSIDVKENEFTKFVLTAKEGYLLPVDVKITSGNQIFIKNVDYTYITSEDRLSGEITIKASKAIDIRIEADEQGYLYIGENKISKSGDYSKFDLTIQGDDEAGKIVYDYPTNTLTLTSSRIFASKVGLKEYTVPFETDVETFSSLIGWTGGGTLNIKFNDLNYFSGSEENDDDVAIICPFNEGKINIVGPGVVYFSEFEEGTILNSRGRTSINNVYFESGDLGEFAIASRELDISNSDLQFASDELVNDSVGIYANDCTLSNSYISSSGFNDGAKVSQLVLVDSIFEAYGYEIGIYADWLYTYGHEVDGKYSTKIHAQGSSFGITTLDAMELTNTEIKAIATDEMNGYAFITVDSEIIAYNCDIYAHANVGQAVHAHYLELTNCDVLAECDDGIGILTSIRGAQPTSRDYEPILVLNNCNVTASGSDVAIYGFGHAEFYNCDNVPKYLEKELSDELQLYMWGLVDESVDELKYEGGFDPQTGAPNFVPSNALKYVSIAKKAEEGSEPRKSITYICDPEKTARIGLGKDVQDITSYYASDRSIEILDLRFYKNFGRVGDQIELEYWAMLYNRSFAVPTFVIVIVDKDGNEIGAFKNHHVSGEGLTRAVFTKDYCVRGNELAIHSLIEDYKENGLQNYQVYLESIIID